MAMDSRIGAAALALAIAALPGAHAADAPANRNVRSSDPATVASGIYVTDPEHSRVTWTVGHHGYSHFTALFPKLEATLTLDAANPENSHVVATVDMNVIGTMVYPVEGNATFQKILQSADVFNVAKFRTATFISTKVQRTAPNKATVSGNLTLLGVTKPATMQVTFNQAGEGPVPGYRIGFDAGMTINRFDWGTQGLAGNISNDVTLTIEAEFLRPRTGQ